MALSHLNGTRTNMDALMTHATSLCERLKRLGFAKENQMRLYGQEFELKSDPIQIGEDLVFIDAVEKKSRQFSRIRVPSMIVRMASSETRAA
jgi:hypothetical protein